MATARTENTFGGVVQLVNRLQRAAGNIGDNAASDGGGGMPSLWNLLPSIVVIGGQVSWWSRANLTAFLSLLTLVKFLAAATSRQLAA